MTSTGKLTKRPIGRVAAALAIIAIAATGCSSTGSSAQHPASSSADGTSSAATSTTSNGEFPRKITVPAGMGMPKTELTIKAAPRRIAALSYETAELVAQYGLADRLVVVPQAVRNPVLTNHLSQMRAVPNAFPSEGAINPEAILAQKPDLILMSARHGEATSVGKALAATGTPVLILPNAWSDQSELALNNKLVGQAIGADSGAAKLDSALQRGLVAHKRKHSPRILVLNNQAGRPFITAGKAFPLDLVRLAGGTDVSAQMGMHITGPITAEQIVKANPDGILMVDMLGGGKKSFASVMNNSAVARLAAVKSGRVMLVQGRDVQALGLTRTITGLGELNKWFDTFPNK